MIENKVYIWPALFSGVLLLVYGEGRIETVGTPLHDSFPCSSTFALSDFNGLPFLLSLSSMSPELRQLSPLPSPPLDMGAVRPPSSSHFTPTSPLIGGNFQTPIPTYQHNPPLVPYSHGYGFPPSHANPTQPGNHAQMGRLGECVIFIIVKTSPQITYITPQNMFATHEVHPGGGITERLLTELVASNHLMQRQIENVDRRLAEIT